MTPRQRDVFLYSWAQRRRRGRLRNALMCAGFGAVGGLLFAVMLGSGSTGQLTPGNLASPSTGTISAWLDNMLLLGMAVPVFAALAGSLGDRVFRMNEAMFRRLLAEGASVPLLRPTLRSSERGPQIAVAVTALSIAGGIAALWVTLG